MATFRCVVSGTVITFTQQHDIDAMRGHEGYVRLDETDEKVGEIRTDTAFAPPQRRPGRPRKIQHVRD